MKSGRRLAAVALLGLLLVTGLTACRANPAVAAYVGDTEITEQRVNEVVDALRASYEQEIEDELAAMREQNNALDDNAIQELRGDMHQLMNDELAVARERVATFLVLTEAGTVYAEAEGISVPELATAQPAQAVQLPEDHPYVQVLASFVAVTRALEEAAEPVEPSESDQREAYDNLNVGGQPVTEPFEEIQQYLNADALAGPVGVRDLLTTVIERADVRVQPGYDLEYQVPVQVGQASSYLVVQISEPSSVIDAS